ncbi:hypothetical protein QVD17_00979 [Tagetes erecta]|uniref:Leucine-rich repeat-containing N-terminal plant-type domain-containing protein n=1 Tax=Tagetes erecta TaxID=13708 RepID=A0AAD8L8W8_TARER|nr:hypothetical protein QVD17_00979 [Tagetes erecta]
MHCVLFILSLLLLWLKVTIGTDYKCIDKERHALLHFKSCIHQDPKGLLSTWIEATSDCCNWSGITCNNQTGHVTSIVLKDGQLRGEISPSLLNLTYLQNLELWENFFKGTIPKFIGSMNELRYLDLSSNDFTGVIPPELGNLTNLQSLSLENLEGCTLKSLDWLTHLSHLECLYIGGISLAKVNHWVDMILSLRKLSSLTLDGCDLSQVMHPYSYSSFNSSSTSISTLALMNNNLNSSMYHWLFPLTTNKLETLDFSGNKLDWIPKSFGNLCNLASFQCVNNSMAVKFLDFINNFTGCASATLQNFIAESNQFTGSFPDDIQKFPSLDTLYLSDNKLNGSISEKVWQLPKLRFLDVSFNTLNFTTVEDNGKSNISKLDLSKSSLVFLGLSFSNLGHVFPKWVQRLKRLVYLDISNTGISDIIPLEFWNMWHSQLIFLSLSSNNISGKITDLQSNFDGGSIIDLSSNNFYGPIPKVHSYVQILDLSKNRFYGGISFLCEIANSTLLTSLDLSNNSLTGPIPDCLWRFRGLQVLNLGQNYFAGKLPSTFEYLINLEALYLHNNNFSGELPLSLQNCTKLTFLHLGVNKFSGYVPTWIGEKFSGLYAFSLKSNNFFGTIPLEICQLVNLQILDMSMNHLVGTIPSCLNNLTTMIQNGSSPNQNVHYYSQFTYIREYVDHAMIEWQGSEREFSSTLGLVMSIDLSCNNLVGNIPPELTDLHELIVMNLSNNALLGEIPQKIGDMKKLLTLDLSRNNLIGEIPSSMSQMTSLSYLDVSHNNLFGKIPSSTQLQSFAPSSYIGNPGLCGPPLTKYCPDDKDPQVPHHVDQNEGDVQIWFYVGVATGFATGFWIACGALLVSRRGRNAFFHFVDSFKDWVYVKMMVFKRKLQQAHY